MTKFLLITEGEYSDYSICTLFAVPNGRDPKADLENFAKGNESLDSIKEWRARRTKLDEIAAAVGLGINKQAFDIVIAYLKTLGYTEQNYLEANYGFSTFKPFFSEGT